MNETIVRPFSGISPSRETQRVGLSYVAIVVSVIVVSGLWVSGRDQLLRIALPAMATLTAVSLYFSRPLIYIQYSLWVWFLSPLVRRIIDWRFGFLEPNLVLLAPLLVSGVAGLTLVVPSRRTNTRIPTAFVLCGGAIAYGFIVGMTLHPSAETVYGLCNWLCPMLFGLHLFLKWPQFEEHRAAITRTFLWGVLILGLYGLYQYFFAPSWDCYWLQNVMVGGQNESFGRPEPFQLRVWSTLNSPGPFANVMLAGLLVLFAVRSSWRLPALVVGYLSLLLSLARTVWLSWVVGLFILLRKSSPRTMARVLALIIFLGACLLPLVNDRPFANVLGDRFKTFSDLGHDESFEARLDMYRTLATEVIDHPFGYGVSNDSTAKVDSGILSLLFSLGWFGGLLYVAGVIGLLAEDKSALREAGHFMVVCRAVVIALLAQIIGGNIFVGVSGTIFWAFGAIYLAGIRHNSREERVQERLATAEA
jgi:hypothetical protein